MRSNLTNKYNPQELTVNLIKTKKCSNLTNKYNPQEHRNHWISAFQVQILPINTILKNGVIFMYIVSIVQILPINTILKNDAEAMLFDEFVQILPINTILKNQSDSHFRKLLFKSYQ